MSMTLGRCEFCGRRAYTQPVMTYPPDAGTEERSLCRDCAGPRWRVPVWTEALEHVLDELDEYLETRADVDHDVDEGVLVQHANDEARLLARLREAREGRGY